MITIIYIVVTFWLAFKLGRKYQDLQDLMLARRVAKLVGQREQLDKEREDYEHWVKQDKRIAKTLAKEMTADD